MIQEENGTSSWYVNSLVSLCSISHFLPKWFHSIFLDGGSFAKVQHLDMVSPMIGWTTGLATCLILVGIAMEGDVS